MKRASTLLFALSLACSASGGDELARSFADPPESARPWVYWFWMDGNLNREDSALMSSGLLGPVAVQAEATDGEDGQRN